MDNVTVINAVFIFNGSHLAVIVESTSIQLFQITRNCILNGHRKRIKQ